MTRSTFTQALSSRTDGRPVRPLFPEDEVRASPLSTGSTATVPSAASSPLAAVSDTNRARRTLPKIPRPASDSTHSKIPAVSAAPKVAEPTKRVALPAVKPTIAEPVKETTVQSAAAPKPAKPKAIKRRNRSRVLTERDRVILEYLSIVRIAKAEHIMELIQNYQNPDVRTGEIKPPSLRAVEAIMARLMNFKGKGLGYVAFDNQISGHKIWFLTRKGEHLIKTGTRSVIPSNPMWNHYLALAAVAARDIRNGFTVIGDDDINRAARAHRESEKQEYVPIAVLQANPEYKLPEVGKTVPHYFAIPLGNGKAHRPDLVVLKEGMEPVAIEMELNYKSPEKVQENLGGHIRAVREGRIGRVVYFCPDQRIEDFLNSQLAKIVDPATVVDAISITRVNLTNMHADIPKIGGF